MVSNVGAASSTFLQSMQESKDKRGVEPPNKSKELDKIGTIKEQIKSGEYKIDIEKTAESISNELI